MSARAAKRQLVEPDYWTCPHGVRVRPEPALTYGPEVAEFCDKVGFTPDPQQELGLDLIFGIRPDNSPSTFSFCVVCARQNLKSGLFLQACIGWLFVLDDVNEIVWSAHELKTSLGAMSDFEDILTGSPLVSKYLMAGPDHGFYATNGKERCELATGQTLWFQTRTRDGGRGLGKQKVILDEAFKLKSRTVGALLPLVLAQHHPQILRGSSAPPLDDDAADLRDVIDRGRNHKSPELSYLEWLAPREDCKDPDCTHPKDAMTRGLDCALDREHLIRKANPTLTTGRITIGTLRALRQEMPAAEYMRECLGWAESADDADPPELDVRRWNSLANAKAPAPSRGVVVVDVEPDLSAGTIGVAGNGPGGRTILLQTHRRGTAWMAKAVAKLKNQMDVEDVMLHPGSAAAAIGPQLTRKKIKFSPITTTYMAAATADFEIGLDSAQFVHVGQDEFTAAVTAARTKTSGQGRLYARELTPVPLGPVVATSVAAKRWAEVRAAGRKKKPPAPVAVAHTATGRTASSDAPDWNNINF